MTVSELIEKLKEMPQEAIVVFSENKFSSHESAIVSVCSARGGISVVMFGS